jgi:SAM-dependent methyltransferase
MSNKIIPDLSRVKKLYTENILKYGKKAESVGWGSQEKQDLRFSKLLSVVERRDSIISLNELGCGYGELVKFCAKSGYHLKEYYGYDISDQMLIHAREYLNDFPDINLYNSSKIYTKADYTVASGIFNVKFDNKLENWEVYVKSTLVDMFEHSEKGMSFNLLTSYVDYETENLYYANPAFYFDFCKKELSKKINLIHDYPLYEWTITVLK